MSQRRQPDPCFPPIFRCYSFESCCHGWRFFSLHRRPNPPFVWSPCFPRTIQLPLAASPCSRLSRPQSTISQSDFHPVIRPFSPLRLGRSYKLAPEPDGSPLFALLPLVACWRDEPRERLRPLALSLFVFSLFLLWGGVGWWGGGGGRGYVPVHCRSG